MNTHELIDARLDELEAEHGFRMLYACESGSRAWGFASADSDYDVRFLFAWPRERYLSIDPPREDVDLAIDAHDLDLSGWELRKALRLLRKSNGPLIEWLHSPIVYRRTGAEEKLRALAAEIFCPRSCAAHYLGLSKRMMLALLENPEACTAKRYLYGLRSLLAAAHVIRERAPAPVAFTELVEAADLDRMLGHGIDEMIRTKSARKESDPIGAQAILDTYLKNEHQSLSTALDRLPDKRSVPVALLDQVFLELAK